MKQKCIRCVIQLSLDQLHWLDDDDLNIHLDGPPLFLRACVLGQLQHSHLHKPIFPVSLNQELTFDRVLTNCKNPSLFNEVIRGEHVKIELIQVAPDYKGGKILARFETPAHRFLFPEVPPAKGELQQLQLNKSRKYQHPPILTYTCSSTLLETTVQSPVDVIFNESQLDRSSQLNHSTTAADTADSDSETSSCSDEEEHGRRLFTRSALDSSRHVRSSSTSTSRRLFQSERERSYRLDNESHSLSTSRRGLSRSQPSLANTTTPVAAAGATGTVDGYTSAREKLHSLLESYRGSEGERKRQQELPKSPYRVKFKPPVPRFRSDHALSTSGQHNSMRVGGSDDDRGIPLTSRPTTPSYRSPTVGVGPHEWQNCPRRSPKRIRSRSLPSSPAPRAKFPKQLPSPVNLHRQRATTLPNQIPLDRLEAVHLDCGHPDLTPRQYQPQSAPALRPPFIVPRPDPKLISKRNFCGEVGVTAVRHFPPSPPNPTPARSLTSASAAGLGTQRQSSPAPPPTATMATTSGMPHWSRDTSDDELRITTDSESDVDSNDSRDQSPAPVRHTRSNPTTPVKNKPQSTRGIPSLSSTSGKHVSMSARSSTTVRSSNSKRRRKLVSKYLTERSGSASVRGRDGEASPSRVIVDKIQRLRNECCACLRSVESLGEDNLSEDLERLKASLEAEREETLNKSARLLPDKSVTVQVGPRDYWSRRMAQYTGKRHRVLFDETLEKIYNRLYSDATNSA